MTDDHSAEDIWYLTSLVKPLLDYPADLHIRRSTDEMGVLMIIKVHATDMGKIIGREGNTAKAIRTMLRTYGMRHQARLNMKIEEPEGGRSYSGTSVNPGV